MIQYRFKSSLIFFTFFVFIISYSQNNKIDDKVQVVELLKKSKSYYQKNKQFSFRINYELFAGNSKKAIEQYSGFFVRKADNYYSKIGDSECIQTLGFTLKIDHETKLMQYFKESKSSESIVYDMTSYYGNFGAFELKSDADYWICTLSAREVTFVPYSKVVLFLSKKDYSIVKQELYLITTVTIKNQEVFPVLKIFFSDFKAEIQRDDYFEINKYITLKKGKYYPTNSYRSYQIVD